MIYFTSQISPINLKYRISPFLRTIDIPFHSSISTKNPNPPAPLPTTPQSGRVVG